MNILALDVSSKTGYALYKDGAPIKWGTIFWDKKAADYGPYPFNYVAFAQDVVDSIFAQLIDEQGENEPEIITIEETNASKMNYSQKVLEYIHFCLIEGLRSRGFPADRIKYVRTGEWRKFVEAHLSKEEKALNGKIGREKTKLKKAILADSTLTEEEKQKKLKTVRAKIDGKVVGRKGRKHTALRRVGEILGIELQRKDEDAADALLLGLALQRGAPVCDGTPKGGKSRKPEQEQVAANG